jgi:hypothetical protein
MKQKVTPVKLTEEERRCANALSLRMPYKCPRNKDGSIAHGLKCLLHLQAKKEGIKLNNSSIYFV